MAVEEFPPIRKWFTELPWRAKPRVPLERASKTVLETGVKSDVAFCLGSSIEKTNSERIFSLTDAERIAVGSLAYACLRHIDFSPLTC